MEGTENQEVVNSHDQIVGKMKSRFADRNFESADGQKSPDSLEQSILDALTEDEKSIGDLTAKNKEYEDNAAKLTALFSNSPRAAAFLNTLATTGDPAAAIYKAYGKEAYDSFNEGNASEVIAAMEADDAKARAENQKAEEEKAKNLEQSFANLDEWGTEKGLDQDQKVAVFMRFYEILNDALNGIYSKDLFEMGWKADHYGEDIESARHEGEVSGRNANIKAQQRKRQENESYPPSLSGQGVRTEESRPVKKEDDPWMLG